jgi:hypothetical protein
MTQAALAKALGLSVGYVSKLCQQGMPKDLEAARTWLDLRKSGRARKLPPSKPLSAGAAAEPSTIGSLTAGTISAALAQHKVLVDRAREVYAAAIEANDPAQGKLQSAYRQSFLLLLEIEAEEKRRAIEAREYIRLTEAVEIITRIMGKVSGKLDKLDLDCAEKANPDRPELAIKVLGAWARETKAAAYNDLNALAAEADAQASPETK